MIFTFPFLHYFIFLCDLLLQDIGFICLRIYLSYAMQMTVTQLSWLFLFHFSVSILHHQNENGKCKQRDQIHIHKQNFKTNYKRIMAEDCNEVIKKSLHTRLLQQHFNVDCSQ